MSKILRFKSIFIFVFLLLFTSCSKYIDAEGTFEMKNGRGDLVEIEYENYIEYFEKKKFTAILSLVSIACMDECTNAATYIPKKVRIKENDEGLIEIDMYYLASNSFGVEGRLYSKLILSADHTSVEFLHSTMNTWPGQD